ncbi:hypothetical protein G5714_022182 [Onychostoma macrolepis]|uniref:Uncharacterized protein n=1 Tax=Onychostoma macrolepis TaxID=369639 RepID=A0A7J6BP95_9TELE|nr:hypothetical protein G5714_022182 [Onychostoma macrolepis]
MSGFQMAQLEDRLTEYVKDTLEYIETIRDFCVQEPKWTSDRRAERKKMRDISEKQQEEKLGAVLKDTLEGLKKLEPFLDAVEKLAVTSSHVFSGQIFLLWGESPERVQSVITDARTDAPLLIHFKRDAETFFRPLLDNVNILIFQLNNYVLKTEQLCNRMRRRKTDQPSVRLILNTSVNDMNQMLHHLKQLCEIRRNEDTRLAFLFQDNAQKFTKVFSERHTRMWQLLSDLEDTAVHLDRMKKGAIISTVAGSSLGIVGGVLSILGIVLVPISAGTSLGLTVAGASLGGVGAVDALVTDSTEMVINSKLEQKAQSNATSYMDDMIEIEDCLTEAVNSEGPLVKPSSVDPHKITHLTFEGIRGSVNVLDTVAAIPVYKSETAIQAAAVELRRAHDVPEVAVYLSTTERLATAKILKFATVARRMTGIINFLSIGLDGYSIYKESKSLAKGSESAVSKLIRSRAALWKSELEAWEKIHDSLRIGIETINETRDTLEKPFLHLLNYYRSCFPC